jgi:ABC-type branched-subunit amino acid transport system permease subunit
LHGDLGTSIFGQFKVTYLIRRALPVSLELMIFTVLIALVIAVLAMLALPWLVIQLSIGRFVLHLLILCLVWSIVAQSWNLVLGVGGIFSFAQLALLGIGGITSGALAKHLGWSPWISIWLAPIAATVAALIIGLPTLRLRGPYVVLLTLAFHELLRNSSWARWIAEATPALRTQTGAGRDKRNDRPIAYYYIASSFVIATYVIWRIFHCPSASFRALRDRDEPPAGWILPLQDAFVRHQRLLHRAGRRLYVHYNGNQSPAILSFVTLSTRWRDCAALGHLLGAHHRHSYHDRVA